jgi:hypothetical protein
MTEPLYLAKSEDGYPALLPQMANRHGLITGATGTGKTVTLQVDGRAPVSAGVPVFMADVKGDLSGMGAAGVSFQAAQSTIADLGLDGFDDPYANPVAFWDVFGQRPSGPRHHLRHGPAAAGPPAQPQRHPGRRPATGLQDRRRPGPAAARPQGPARHGPARRRQRRRIHHHRIRQRLRRLHRRHPARPADARTAGRRRILRRADAEHRRPDADRQRKRPRRHQRARRRQADATPRASTPPSCSGCWPNCSSSCPKSATSTSPSSCSSSTKPTCSSTMRPSPADKVEQVVRLIRSKGVGVYFVTQNPLDIPAGPRPARQPRPARPARLHPARPEGRQGRRRDHARQPAIRRRHGRSPNSASAKRWSPSSTKRADPERGFIFPPASRRRAQAFDRSTANQPTARQTRSRLGPYESARQPAPASQEESGGGLLGGLGNILMGSTGPRGGKREGVLESAAKSAARGVAGTVGREIGKQILRGVLGSILGGRR